MILLQAYVGTADGDVVCVQPSKLNVITSLTHHTDAVKSIAGMSGCQLVSTSSDNTVQAWAWNKAASNTTKLQSITGKSNSWSFVNMII